MKQLCSTLALSKAGAILALLCCCSVLANAEDISTVPVAMGKAEILARASQPFSQASSSIGRVTTIDSGADGANRYLLLYYAPNRSADYRDEITYNLNGETERMAAVVRNSPVLAGENIYQESFKALFALFVLAILVESALSVLFRWRPYLNSFNSRGLNSVIAVAVSLVLVLAFGMDITTTLMNLYNVNGAYTSGPMGIALTALIIAGGSAGVNNILRSLGFREVLKPDTEMVRPPPDKAWLSVTHRRGDSDDPVNVLLRVDNREVVVGSITASKSPGWFARNFLRNKGRFPPSGGYILDPNLSYEVKLQGNVFRDGAFRVVRSESWGPYEIAKGAIIDLELTPRVVDTS